MYITKNLRLYLKNYLQNTQQVELEEFRQLLNTLKKKYCDDHDILNILDWYGYYIKLVNTPGVSYRTFPMVFYSGQFIGGYTETKKWWDQQQAFLELDSESD